MDNSYIPFLKTAISFLKEEGKSEDIASLFMKIETPAPSLLHDFMMEISLAADPKETAGLGCYSADILEQALKEVEQKGTTELLYSSRH